MRAQKGNRQYAITNAQVDSYLKQGFDIFGENGKIIEYGTGKSVPYSQYVEVLDELTELKKNGVDKVDKALKLENDSLKEQIEALKLDLEVSQTQKPKK